MSLAAARPALVAEIKLTRMPVDVGALQLRAERDGRAQAGKGTCGRGLTRAFGAREHSAGGICGLVSSGSAVFFFGEAEIPRTKGEGEMLASGLAPNLWALDHPRSRRRCAREPIKSPWSV